MSTATFTTYDAGNSENDLHAHDGETVELIGEAFQPDQDEPDLIMQNIRFSDGTVTLAFQDELTNVKEA